MRILINLPDFSKEVWTSNKFSPNSKSVFLLKFYFKFCMEFELTSKRKVVQCESVYTHAKFGESFSNRRWECVFYKLSATYLSPGAYKRASAGESSLLPSLFPQRRGPPTAKTRHWLATISSHHLSIPSAQILPSTSRFFSTRSSSSGWALVACRRRLSLPPRRALRWAPLSRSPLRTSSVVAHSPSSIVHFTCSSQDFSRRRVGASRAKYHSRPRWLRANACCTCSSLPGHYGSGPHGIPSEQSPFSISNGFSLEFKFKFHLS
jgi:hypothetical protein